MNDQISIKAMTEYEKQTGGNALKLLGNADQSVTELCWKVWMLLYTKDQTTTFEKVTNLSADEFAKVVAQFSEEAPKA